MVVAQLAPLAEIGTAAVVGAATVAATATVAWASAKLAAAQAGLVNAVAGTRVGAVVGYPNRVAPNRGGQLQPRDSRGRWLPNSANPGFKAALASNQGVHAIVGATQGAIAGWQGVPAPMGVSETQQRWIERGEAAGTLAQKLKETLVDKED